MKTGTPKPLRLLLICVSPLFLYVLAGFVLLPAALHYYLTHQLAEKTGYEINIKRITFNPFSFRLDIIEANMHSKDQSLLGFSHLTLDYELLSLLSDEYIVELIDLQKPYVELAINSKGELAIQQVFARLTGESKSDDTDTAIPALRIRQLKIGQGTIDFATEQLPHRLQQTWQLPYLTLDDFHTHYADLPNYLALEIRNDDNAHVKISGNIDLARQQFHGLLDIGKLQVNPFIAAFDTPFTGHIAQLPVDFSTGIKLQFKDALAVKLSNADLRLHTLKISKTAGSPLLVDIPLIHLKGIDVDLLKQKITLDSIAASQGNLQFSLNKQGQNNWQELLKTEPEVSATVPVPATSTAQAPAPAPEKNWQVLIRQIQVKNYALQFLNEQPATPVDMQLSPINLTIKQWQPLAGNKAFPLQLETGFNEDGHLAVDTQLQTRPLLATGKASLKNLSLPFLQPYIDGIVHVNVRKGQLESNVDFSIQQEQALALQVKGTVLVNDLKTYKKGSKKKLLAWKKMAIDSFQYTLPANSLSINQIDISQAYGRVVITESGETNLQGLFVPSAETTPADTRNTATTPLAWSISHINIDDGDMGFADLSLPQGFATSIKDLSGSIRNISSLANDMANVKLLGKVDRYAPVNIAGTFNLSSEKPALDMAMNFKNIELTTYTPYSGIYAGYAIDKGQLSMDLQYVLLDNRIKGKNHIVINQLKLGKKVESTKAVDLPLKLAIALLSDENGVIDMGFDVKGDISDPKFSLNNIIFKTLRETIKKTVSAPFKYLGGVFKTKQKNVQKLAFNPGSDEINGVIVEKLDIVAKFMQSRKKLQLNIQGNVLPAVDKPVLQENELLQILAVETRQSPEKFLPSSRPESNTELFDIVKDYYEKQYAEKFNRLEQRIAEQAIYEKKPLGTEEIRQQAYAQAWQRLIEQTAIRNEEIRNLGLRRARQVKAALIERHGINADRIFILDSSSQPSLVTDLYVDVR